MTLLKELIDIPEHLDQGQFVLRLTEGVVHPEATVGSYVATDQLVKAFDNALGFIKGAVVENKSKASYLHGSFGSGKSHFMAVLQLILEGHPAARGIEKLEDVVTRHTEWTRGRSFLLVPYHMLGATSVEEGIFSGYVKHIQRLHPEAPIPGVYRAESMFEDAQTLRGRMGDDAFFATLNEGITGDSGWGDLDAAWDLDRFETAIAAAPANEERSQLISILVRKFYSSYSTQTSGRDEEFLPLDQGLAVISQHAKSLKYDGVILFLDELILWLASRAADLAFVHREGQKLVKLVEYQDANRPVPIIAFIARQRDLSELIGDSVPGADKVNFSDALKHWEGRFHKITLEDRNLPAIAEKRILKPRSEAARAELHAAFTKTAKMKDSVLNTLLTKEGNLDEFRRVYPFSPALIQTLIAVSSVLQRERTALKVMMQLLVNQRETLEVGGLIPVGDLFDVVAQGAEAFSASMALHFENAKRLYLRKLQPLLETEYGRREDIEKLPWNDSRRVGFRNDDRIMKTLLIAALVPEVEALRALNAERLATLNHGTIKSPIPGGEVQMVLAKCRKWCGVVGELRVGEEANPTISLHLSGVDTDRILANAEAYDSRGNRIRLVRQFLYDLLEVKGQDETEQYYAWLWRNTRRDATILFSNVRELPPTSFENSQKNWKLIIDYPIDDPGFGPRDDLAKVHEFSEQHQNSTKTLVWLPRFFSEAAENDLKTLVKLEHIFTGNWFNEYSNHLSPLERQSARTVLEQQRHSLRQRVRSHLEAVYGLTALLDNSIDTSRDLHPHEQFTSLTNGMDLQPPNCGNLKQAMESLLEQALASEFPGAPLFGEEVRTVSLKKVHAILSAGLQKGEKRILVEPSDRRLLRHIAEPMMLGEMRHDTDNFLPNSHWSDHFKRKSHQAGGVLQVQTLRDWIDEPKPMGLPVEAQNLILMLFAEESNYTFMEHNGPEEPSLTRLRDTWVLKAQSLPDETTWRMAIDRSGKLFGMKTSPLLNATNASQLSGRLLESAKSCRSAVNEYYTLLRKRLTDLGVDLTTANRLKTADASTELIESLANARDTEIINCLANARIETSETAMGTAIGQADRFRQSLSNQAWTIFSGLITIQDQRQADARAILKDLVEALTSDEHVMPLVETADNCQSQALRMLTTTTPAPVAPPIPGPQIAVPVTHPVGPASTAPDGMVLPPRGQNIKADLSADSAMDAIKQIKKELKKGQSARITITWTIDQP